MKSVKAYYDGKKIKLVNPLPKDITNKKSFVIITFPDEDKEIKVPKGVKNGVLDIVKDNFYDLKDVLNEI